MLSEIDEKLDLKIRRVFLMNTDAIIKIQSLFRGYKTRKMYAKMLSTKRFGEIALKIRNLHLLRLKNNAFEM